jgi:hypothetical protein
MKQFAVLFAFLLLAAPSVILADADDASFSFTPGKEPLATLNYRSKYYSDWFSEPFRVEDTTIDNELRLDWQYAAGHGSTSNLLTAEIQKSVGIFTFEVQEPYVWNTGAGGGSDDGDDNTGSGSTRGFGNLELAVRLPLLQSVSKSGFLDNSIGANFEFGIPTNSAVSKNAEITPGLFDDLAIGDHFSVQSLFSFTHTFGTLSNSVGTQPIGRASFSYGLAFGYAIEDEQFSIPHVERLIPTIELVGSTALDGPAAGHNALTGTAGLRAEFKSIFHVQPSFGVGYLFPIDSGGREQLRWGILTSLTFEF